MRRTLEVLAVTVLAVGMLTALVGVVGAGLNPIITGVATCNTSTGEYDITWTLSDVLSAGPFDITNPGDVTATPGGAVSQVDFSPTTVPLDGDSIAAGSVPGTTTSAHISVFANSGPRNFDIGAAEGLLGTCTIGTPPSPPTSGGQTAPTAVVAAPATIG